MWVGLLFSVMSMSAFLQQQDVSSLGLSTVEPQDALESYRTLTIHCLILGNYLEPSRYTIEALILHYSVDQQMNVDVSLGDWILIGVIIRIALRMGLHRDSSHWPDIRPYQSELRRRLWIILYQMDFFTSTQVGLPRIIKDSQCDARLPTHLFEQDIGFEHDEMPPERPFTETTPLLFIIQRNTIIRVAAEIYDETEAGPPSPATNAALTAKLESAIDAIPTWLKYKPLETSFAENPVMILNQIFFDILIHKAVYLLHRRNFMKGTSVEESTKSNELCIKASLSILEHQQRISEETQPGGLMFAIRWKVSTSLNHEFLQATMMLCFALSRVNERYGAMPDSFAMQRRDDILKALAQAKGLWEKNSNQSMEARRAAKAITTVLRQDLDESSAPTLIASDGENSLSYCSFLLLIYNSIGLFDQITGEATQSYFGSFDYEQDMALDPYFFAADSDMGTYGSILDDLVTEQSYI